MINHESLLQQLHHVYGNGAQEEPQSASFLLRGTEVTPAQAIRYLAGQDADQEAKPKKKRRRKERNRY